MNVVCCQVEVSAKGRSLVCVRFLECEVTSQVRIAFKTSNVLFNMFSVKEFRYLRPYIDVF